jgi:peptidoglycan/LPS O-acetylase OafA/YrhL
MTFLRPELTSGDRHHLLIIERPSTAVPLLEPNRLGRLPAIDGLRAVAMTMVVAQHCGLLPCGWIGVWLFYVISGFVICRTLLAERRAPSGRRYGRFIARRFFRIVSIYFCYILLNIAVMVMAGRYGSLRDVPFLLTFSYNWQMIFSIWDIHDGFAAFGHLWTLSVEQQFYLIFPVLFLCLPRRMFLWLTAILVVAGPLVRFLFSEFIATMPEAHDPNWAAYAVYAASFTQFDAFLVGTLLAVAEPHLRVSRLALMLPVVAIALAVLYVATFVLVNHANGATGVGIVRNIISGTLYGQFREVFVYSVVDLLAASAILHVMRGGHGTRLLASPFLALVGRVSYGGYLFHALVLLVAALLLKQSVGQLPLPERLGCFVLVWIVTGSIAYVSFHCFENRVISWSKRTAVPGMRASRA